MKTRLLLTTAIIIAPLFLASCSKDNNNGKIQNEGVPALLYGKWDGSDNRGQCLTFIIRKDGTCHYSRETYVNSDGIFTYDVSEKRITTTIEENGGGSVVYIIELLTENDLVVKRPTSEYRTSYTKDKTYNEK